MRRLEKNTRCKFPNGEHTIIPVKLMKYLGLTFDHRMSFIKHILEMQEKSTKLLKNIQMLLPNIHGPKEKKRKILAGSIMSMVTYGAQIYYGVLEIKKYRNIIRQIQRTALLGVASAYRTTSIEWTRPIMPNINQWMENKGETDYYLSKILTGHGCFQKYMEKIKREKTVNADTAPKRMTRNTPY